MDDLLLHPATAKSLDQALASHHHAIALIGQAGAGKGHIAEMLAKKLLAKPNEYSLYIVQPENPLSIGIDDVRALQAFLRLKSIGTDRVRRVVIMEDAQLMTLDAQNALLKILEEPPVDTKIILTINSGESLRPTVYSRLQQIHIKPVTLDAALTYFMKQGHDEAHIKRAYLISDGNAGLCHALLSDKEHHLVKAIADAKTFLAGSTYDRLLSVDALSKDKEQLGVFIFALKRVLTAAARQNGQKAMLMRLTHVHATEAALSSNPNLKLLLSDLALQL